MSATHNALIYVRQSAAKEESISLETQETSAREHCARYGYRVLDVISDPGVSGLKWDQRKGVQHLLKRVENGDADRVIVWRWSRLSRRSVHQHLAIDRIESAGAIVESSTEPFDTKTAGGAFGRDVMLASAAFESKQKSEQWLDAHNHRLNLGLPASARQRFGYTWHNESAAEERYEIDEDEAEVVRWMYSSYIAGKGVPSIVRELNRLGIVGKNGLEWNRKKVTTYLDSGFAAGLIVKVGARTGQNYERLPFHKREFLSGAHEAIISEQTWEEYKAIKAGRAKIPPRRINPTNPLSGLVQCADCDGAMTRHVTKTRDNGRTHVGFTCSNRNRGMLVRSCSIAEPTLFRIVWEWLRELADDVGDVAERAAQQQQAQLRTRADADKAAKEVADIDTQLANLTKQLVAGRVPESAYDATRDELLADRARAEERRELAEAETNRESDEPASDIASGLLAEWDELPADELNKVLRKLVRHVRVTPPTKKWGRASAQVIGVWE